MFSGGREKERWAALEADVALMWRLGGVHAPRRHKDEVSAGSDHVGQRSAELHNALEVGVLGGHGLDLRLVLGLASAQNHNLCVADLGQRLFQVGRGGSGNAAVMMVVVVVVVVVVPSM